MQAAAMAAEPGPWGTDQQRALYEFWCGKRRPGQALPAWSEFDPIELRPWLGDLNLLDVIDGGRDFRYRVHGTRIGQLHGVEMTGRLVSDWPETSRNRAFRTYRRAMTVAKPHLVCEHEFLDGYPRVHTRLVLPFGEDHQTLDKLLVHLVIGGRMPEESAAEYHILG